MGKSQTKNRTFRQRKREQTKSFQKVATKSRKTANKRQARLLKEKEKQDRMAVKKRKEAEGKRALEKSRAGKKTPKDK